MRLRYLENTHGKQIGQIEEISDRNGQWFIDNGLAVLLKPASKKQIESPANKEMKPAKKTTYKTK